MWRVCLQRWMHLCLLVGGGFAWWSGKRVAITDMPQMIALYNGMGGGAAAAIAAVELYHGEMESYAASVLAVVGGIIGAVSFSGSAIAFGKLQGLIKRSIRFGGQQILNLLLLVAALVLGALVALHINTTPAVVTAFFVVALLLGLTMTLPIGGADMPVVIPTRRRMSLSSSVARAPVFRASKTGCSISTIRACCMVTRRKPARS